MDKAIDTAGLVPLAPAGADVKTDIRQKTSAVSCGLPRLTATRTRRVALLCARASEVRTCPKAPFALLLDAGRCQRLKP